MAPFFAIMKQSYWSVQFQGEIRVQDDETQKSHNEAILSRRRPNIKFLMVFNSHLGSAVTGGYILGSE